MDWIKFCNVVGCNPTGKCTVTESKFKGMNGILFKQIGWWMLPENKWHGYSKQFHQETKGIMHLLIEIYHNIHNAISGILSENQEISSDSATFCDKIANSSAEASVWSTPVIIWLICIRENGIKWNKTFFWQISNKVRNKSSHTDGQVDLFF